MGSESQAKRKRRKAKLKAVKEKLMDVAQTVSAGLKAIPEVVPTPKISVPTAKTIEE